MIDILTNLGIGIEPLVLILTFFGSLIFMAKDFRLALIIFWLLVGVELGTFYSLNTYESYNLNVTYHLLTFLSTFVVMAISLLGTYARTKPQEVA